MDREARWAELTDCMGRYADGDASVFPRLYELLRPLVWRTHRRWFDPPAAEDLTQKTFLRLHRQRHRYQRGSPVGPWVRTIARNLAVDEARRQGRSAERLTREGTLPERTAERRRDRLEVEAERARVRAAVARLPDGQREVVELHKLEGLSFIEVAARLRIRPGAARVRAHRAYLVLRGLLEGVPA